MLEIAAYREEAWQTARALAHRYASRRSAALNWGTLRGTSIQHRHCDNPTSYRPREAHG